MITFALGQVEIAFALLTAPLRTRWSVWTRSSAGCLARETRASSVGEQLVYISMLQVRRILSEVVAIENYFPPACPAGWLRFEDSCYREAALSSSAQEAEDLCREHDAHLFMPESVEEWDWVVDVFK